MKPRKVPVVDFWLLNSSSSPFGYQREIQQNGRRCETVWRQKGGALFSVFQFSVFPDRVIID